MCLSLKSCLRTLVVLLILKHLYFLWWDFGTLEYYVYLCFNFMMLLMQLLISLSVSIFSVCWNWFWKDTIRYWCHELMDMHDINIYIYIYICRYFKIMYAHVCAFSLFVVFSYAILLFQSFLLFMAVGSYKFEHFRG